MEEPCGVQENIGNDESSGSSRHVTMEPSAISCKVSVYSVINYVEFVKLKVKVNRIGFPF